MQINDVENYTALLFINPILTIEDLDKPEISGIA